MEKFSRNQRITAITKLLVDNPNKIITLNNFTEALNAAKSTISEDLVIVKKTFSKLSLGRIETISGAAGGVKYVCGLPESEIKKFIEELCTDVADKNRIIPGNYLYMTDLMYNPVIIHKAGTILATCFIDKDIDYVVTVETKGVPLAYEVASMLGVQLVIVRRDNRVTEGTTVSINYVSGSNNRIQTMSLARKAIKGGSSCIFIDDFLKAGGTAVGIINLLKEFGSRLIGIGVLVDDIENPKKLVKDYYSILKYKGINEDGQAMIEPSDLQNNKL